MYKIMYNNYISHMTCFSKPMIYFTWLYHISNFQKNNWFTIELFVNQQKSSAKQSVIPAFSFNKIWFWWCYINWKRSSKAKQGFLRIFVNINVLLGWTWGWTCCWWLNNFSSLEFKTWSACVNDRFLLHYNDTIFKVAPVKILLSQMCIVTIKENEIYLFINYVKKATCFSNIWYFFRNYKMYVKVSKLIYQHSRITWQYYTQPMAFYAGT